MNCQIELMATGKGFCGIQGNPYSEHRKNAQEAIQLALQKIEAGQPDILILDEINNALHLRLVDLDQVLKIIESRPSPMHIVLTGRNARPHVIELADTVSEIIEVKHAYRKGIEPQPGSDYWFLFISSLRFSFLLRISKRAGARGTSTRILRLNGD